MEMSFYNVLVVHVLVLWDTHTTQGRMANATPWQEND